MPASENSFTAKPFEYIYLENGTENTSAARNILRHFPGAHLIPVVHWKDVFNRPRQSFRWQHPSASLILARRTGRLIYPGAPVCQSFGEEHFYYTSLCMNCPFDCDYCFLKGMYPTGNLALFVNLEDYFRELEELLLRHPVYLCISYDTDLAALESLTGYIHAFRTFMDTHPGLTVEVRTKCACAPLLRELEPSPRMIFAFTLSPENVIKAFEHMTAPLPARLDAVRTALDLGHPARICFDPMIHVPDWRGAYQALVQEIFNSLGRERLNRLRDVSVGTFRISGGYLRTLRHALPDSPAVQFPFEQIQGYYQYPPELAGEMESEMVRLLLPCIPRDRIFRWEEST